MADTKTFYPLDTTLVEGGDFRGAQFVDFAGLDYFWSLAKNYVDTADAALAARATALETTVNGTPNAEGVLENGLVQKVAALRSEVDALGGAEGGIQGMIDASINALDVTDAAVDGQYVSSVSETDGKISVSRAALPDWTDTINGAADAALEAAKKYVDDMKISDAISTAKGEAIDDAKDYTDAREVEIDKKWAAADATLQGNIDTVAGDLDTHVKDAVAHVTADERTAWNKAKSDIDAFLANAGFDEEGKNVVDTLKELQEYMKGDGEAAAELVNRVGALETAVGDAESGLVKTVADMDAAYKAADVTLGQRIDGVAGDLSTLSGTVDANKSAIEKTVADMDAAYKKADSDLEAAYKKADSDLEAALKKYADDAEAQALADAKAHVAEVIANYYTKTEVDELLDNKSDLSYVNDELAKKADKETTYTKTEVEGLLAANSTADQAYAKGYVDTLFSEITFVSKASIDSLFA
jgi:hypothetical protein